MRTRSLAVLLAMVTLVAVAWGARMVASHGDPAPTSSPRAFPHKYIGVVTYDLAAFNRTCRCSPNIAVHYLHLGGPMDMSLARSFLAAGAVPLLELEPYGIPLTKIIDGGEDGWLTKYAQAIANLRSPVIMSFAPEANGSWYMWGYHHVPPRVFVSAWRHVVSVFRKAGAVNVKWVWIMNVDFPGAENIGLLWPGSPFVDMLGIDGYFKYPTDFESHFGSTINAMRAISPDPLLITETAASPSAGKLRAVNQLATGVARDALAGFIWFNVRQHGSLTKQDWTLDGNPAALAAFRREVNSHRRGP